MKKDIPVPYAMTELFRQDRGGYEVLVCMTNEENTRDRLFVIAEDDAHVYNFEVQLVEGAMLLDIFLGIFLEVERLQGYAAVAQKKYHTSVGGRIQ